MAAWRDEAAAFRAERPLEVLKYGKGERERIDLFAASPGAPWAVFIHGGYWQALDGSWFSHLARGLNANGVSVAIPTYDLCPDVSVSMILDQMRTACRVLADSGRAPSVVAGHSAGGHLAACLLADGLTPAAYAISGLFELEPLVPTSVNAKLGLDADEARRLSPALWPGPKGRKLDTVVGGAESAEYLRQSRAMAERWGAAGVQTRFEAVEGANHFTVIAPLADPDSAMTKRVAELAKL
ncbi:MAG: alpha/beta hydrolase [Proteobacteria bacterium]|nr:alpha/beta hydrolase [Pseudomonadota bacterium]